MVLNEWGAAAPGHPGRRYRGIWPPGPNRPSARLLPQEVEVDKDIVKDVAAIHEGGIRDEAFGHKSR
jgi:hypothetical protein